MSKLLKYLSITLLVSLLTACGDPKLDTSTDETMKSSVQNMMSELSPEDKNKFKKTITGIYMIGALSSIRSNKSPEEIKASINSKLNGKTVVEIFEMADKIREKIKNK